jgi:hypothetical protein
MTLCSFHNAGEKTLQVERCFPRLTAVAVAADGIRERRGAYDHHAIVRILWIRINMMRFDGLFY